MKRLPAVLFGLTLAVEVAAVALSIGLEPSYDTFLYAVYSVVWAGAGALVASCRPRNPIGWLFCGFALLNAVMADAAQGWALRAAEEGWRGRDVAYLVSSAGRQPSGLGWILTFLLIPDGRIPHRRWRVVGWVAATGTVLTMLGWALSPGLNTDFPGGRNPYAVDALPTDAMFAAGLALTIGALVASSGLLARRLRRSEGVERQQLRVFVLAAAAMATIVPMGFALWFVTPLGAVVIALALTALPIAACVAILHYRLYEVDAVVTRTLVYGMVTLLLAVAFAATVLVLGTALGGGSALATAGATLVVAVAFRPLRDRVQASVDRRFNRARYDALHRMAAFVEALRAGQAAPEDVVEILREALSDPRLELLYILPESEHLVDARGAPAMQWPDDGRERVPIQHAGRLVGVVVHSAGTAEETALLPQLVEAGKLAIEISRLRVELRRQLAEVEASRARILAAGNEERRRIERDLHDGAQQRLVSIGLALRHAQHQVRASGPDAADRTLDAAVAEVAVAIDELRGLARGLPPSQLDAGLSPAFRELARRAPLPVLVKAPSERFDRGVEAAAYFIGCEGVTNAVKHSRATRVFLTAQRRNGTLVVSVADNGVGGAAPIRGSGLHGLCDRVAALGGTLQIESPQGTGTTLTAELPCEL